MREIFAAVSYRNRRAQNYFCNTFGRNGNRPSETFFIFPGALKCWCGTMATLKYLSLPKICKLSRELLCVIVGLCWRSVFPMIFVTASLAVLCLASASDVVVFSGATGRTGSLIYKALKEQNVNVRGFIRNVTKARERLGMCCLRCFRRHLCW